MKATAALFLGLICSQPTLAEHHKPTERDIAAIVQAVEDEIYDWSYENDFTGVGNTGAVTSPTDVPLFVSPDIEDGRGGVLYKFMPFGEVVRLVWFRPDGTAVLEGNPWNGFPASQPDTRTIYVDDDFVCQYKQKAIRATFTVDPNVSQARRLEAIQRQIVRLGHSEFRDTRPNKAAGKTLPRGSGITSVSLNALSISSGERIVGFTFQVVSGRTAQIRDMPPGWNISVDNDPSWNTKIDASIIVASAAVDPRFFKDFLVIEREPDSEKPFAIAGEVLVSRDFSAVRRIKVGMKDFATIPSAPRTPR